MPYADPPLAGRYHLLEVVGVGGAGEVWRAWDLREHRFVAVKLLHPRDADRSDRLVRFVREQAVRVSHPHVAAPTGWVGDDERVALTMELAGGGSLADLVRERRGEPFAASYVAEVVGQLLDALVAVHAAGVVHRDVKPANLLLDATGRGRPHLRLGDFGIAAPTGSAGEPGTGTPGFAAPEQLDGAPADPRQDLHAVGVTARRLLGRAPGPLDDLVAALSDPDPRRRTTSALEARRRLDDLGVARPLRWPRVPDRFAGLGPTPLPVPRATRSLDPAPRRRHRWLLAAGFTAGGVVSSAASYAVLAQR